MSPFIKLQDCSTITVAGATTDERLAQMGRELKQNCPGVTLHLIRPNRSKMFTAGIYDRITNGHTDGLCPEDLTAIESDAAILAISHVTRPSYTALIRQLDTQTEQMMVWTAEGLQPVDARDAQTEWPSPIESKTSAPPNEPDKPAIIFFRASDQSVKTIAQQRREEGCTVCFADTIKALEAQLPDADVVFFDWCLTDYSILFPAFQLAVTANKYLEAFVALDLTDVAEIDSVCRLLTYLNRSALPLLHKAHVLSTRSFITERYGLDQSRVAPLDNLPDETIWNRGYAHREPDGVIHFVYHGLMYFWHELAEFLPIFEAVQDLAPAQLDVYGRVHESISCGTVSLFPHLEQVVRRKLDELWIMPGVTLHGFTSPRETAKAVSDADFYVGITAGRTLMAQTEMRTGVIEAMMTGCRVLHKPTQGIRAAGHIAHKDFLPVDSAHPVDAAKAIVAEFEGNR